MKPIIKYCGGKSREIKYFAKYFPDSFETYYEPFLGGGAVFFEFMPKKAVLSDSNQQLMRFYHDFAKHSSRIIMELKELAAEYKYNQLNYEIDKAAHPDERVVNFNENRYYLMRDMLNGRVPPAYSFATIYYYINQTAYACLTRFNQHGEFNTPFGHHRKINIDKADLAHAQALQQAELKCQSYEAAFESMTEKDFAFLDPPYDGTFKRYGKDPFGPEEHVKLAQDFKNLSGKALMVIGKTPLTESLYKDFIRGEYGVKYAIDVKNRFQKENTHLIVTNY